MATVTIPGVGVEIAYDDLPGGSGTPFVWGHGLTQSRAHEDRWALLDFERLARDRRVVRYDARGHGASGDLTEAADGAWDRLARDQIALIDHLGIDSVVLAGASMGAATALHAACVLGDRVERLVLVIPPTAWESRSAQVAAYELSAKVVARRGVEPLIAASADLAPPDPFVGDEEYRARSNESLRSADPERLVAVLRSAAHADLPPVEQVTSVAAPTLILAWSGDAGHPVSTAERLAELIPHSELAVATAAHDLAAWTERVVRFLDQR